MKAINVFSMFDGMSCGQLALKKAGIKVNTYHASEIDKYAISITKKNFPSTLQMGDITKLEDWRLELIKDEIGIDLVIGGSPCQGFSFAGNQLNFEDPRSKLFFDFVRVLKILRPKYFLLENVRMKKESQDIISEYMGVEPVAINSNLVSAQNRHRLYWTNIPFDMLEDKGIILADILQPDNEIDVKYLAGEKLLKNYKGGNQLNPTYKSQANTIHNKEGKAGVICAGTHGYANGYVGGKTPSLTPSSWQHNNYLIKKGKGCIQVGEADLKGHDILKRVYSPEGKAPTLNTMGGGNREPKVIVDELTWRKLTPLECERLQTVPDGYTEGVSNTQRYRMLGNGMTVDVIAHILKGIKL